MKVAIHQPEFLPWLGFWHKMDVADLYVVQDKAPYAGRYFHNRNRIRNPHRPIAWQWLTIPVANRSNWKMDEVVALRPTRWRNGMKHVLEQVYKSAPYWNEYGDTIVRLVTEPEPLLIRTNLQIIWFLKAAFGIDTPIVKQSGLGILKSKTELIIDVCKTVGADQYVTGELGPNYLEYDSLDSAGIRVVPADFRHPVYDQGGLPWLSHLSAIDLLLYHGRDSLRIIRASNGR